MKPAEEEATVIASYGAGETLDFGIMTENLGWVMQTLRDLYSNKVLAVIREYSTNAMDAHVEAGIPDTPIEVHLPNVHEPTFVIRDYGTGLDRERLEKVLSYGASTKRHSNSFNGLFGAGSKAAFCYTDTFILRNYHAGQRTTYALTAQRNEKGHASCYDIRPTGEVGVEIRVPVDPKDIKRFIDEAAEFYSTWKVKPKFFGAPQGFSLTPLEYGQGKWQVIRSDVALSNDLNWPDLRKSSAVMAGVTYPLDGAEVLAIVESLGIGVQDPSEGISWSFLLWLDTGSVEIVPSREGLSYTDHTRNGLRKAIQELLNSTLKAAAELFEDRSQINDSRLRHLRRTFTRRQKFLRSIAVSMGIDTSTWPEAELSYPPVVTQQHLPKTARFMEGRQPVQDKRDALGLRWEEISMIAILDQISPFPQSLKDSAIYIAFSTEKTFAELSKKRVSSRAILPDEEVKRLIDEAVAFAKSMGIPWVKIEKASERNKGRGPVEPYVPPAKSQYMSLDLSDIIQLQSQKPSAAWVAGDFVPAKGDLVIRLHTFRWEHQETAATRRWMDKHNRRLHGQKYLLKDLRDAFEAERRVNPNFRVLGTHDPIPADIEAETWEDFLAARSPTSRMARNLRDKQLECVNGNSARDMAWLGDGFVVFQQTFTLLTARRILRFLPRSLCPELSGLERSVLSLGSALEAFRRSNPTIKHKEVAEEIAKELERRGLTDRTGSLVHIIEILEKKAPLALAAVTSPAWSLSAGLQYATRDYLLKQLQGDDAREEGEE
jgi:hypothetical protein